MEGPAGGHDRAAGVRSGPLGRGLNPCRDVGQDVVDLAGGEGVGLGANASNDLPPNPV